ncbi:uncharacterized protein [Heterodontus francisci]|uniref:uncharacterized protein n=1 Tax=Heterodontus francisci TaxID=7792 RepID=UPI00355AD31F
MSDEAARGIQLCLERQQFVSSGCVIEVTCSVIRAENKFEWFRGNEKISADRSHKLQFGGSRLVITLDSQTGGTIYKCKHQATGKEMAFDPRETCGFRDSVEMVPDCSYGYYQTVKITLTSVFLAFCLSALIITCYICREKSRKNQKTKSKGGEEGIYSDLNDLTSGMQPIPQEQAEAGTKGGWKEAGPSGSSDLSEEAKAGPSSGPSLRSQAKAGPRSPEEATSQEPKYTSLKEQSQDEGDQCLRPQGSESQGVATYSAAAEEVTIQASP